MPEEIGLENVAVEASETVDSPGDAFESPPAAQMPERKEVDPRARLAELALELVRTQNRRLLVEYLRMRRGGV